MHAAGSSALGFLLLVSCLAKLLFCFTVFFFNNTNSGYILACVAQMVEHSHGKGKVSGSSPVVGSVKKKMIKYG